MPFYKYNGQLYHGECLDSEEKNDSIIVKYSQGRRCTECEEYLDDDEVDDNEDEDGVSDRDD